MPSLTALPDMRVAFDNLGGDKDISIALVSEDTEALTRAAEAAERGMRGLSGLSSVGTNSGQRQPEITLTVDSVKAARLGITAQQIGDAVNISTIGDNDTRLAKFNYQNRQIPIRVRLPRESGSNLSVIENLKLETPNGASVPLSSTALSLIFMPVLFSYGRDFEEWLVPKFRRLIAAEPQQPSTSLHESAAQIVVSS